MKSKILFLTINFIFCSLINCSDKYITYVAITNSKDYTPEQKKGKTEIKFENGIEIKEESFSMETAVYVWISNNILNDKNNFKKNNTIVIKQTLNIPHISTLLPKLPKLPKLSKKSIYTLYAQKFWDKLFTILIKDDENKLSKLKDSSFIALFSLAYSKCEQNDKYCFNSKIRCKVKNAFYKKLLQKMSTSLSPECNSLYSKFFMP